MNDNADNDPRLHAIPDIHGHAKGEHKAFTDERPIPLSARMLFLWFFHACRRGWPRFLMVTDHMNYLTFEDPAAINLVRRALKLAQAGDLYGAAETASVEVGHAAVVSEGLRRGMRYSIGAEVDNDPRSRPDAQNIVDAMKPDGMIRSVHFLTIDHPIHGPNWNWPFDNPEFADVFELIGTAKTWELYMATLLDAVERLPGNIVGHFYVPAIFGHWPDDATLETYEDQIVDACEARGMALEVNTRFLYRDHSDEQKARYLAVHRRLLAKCKAKNVGIAIGSDAHSPKDQGRGFAAILALLDECEINELVFPIGGRLLRVALRVERKAEPAVDATAGASAEERKALRKPRMSEAPARPKETSSKREEPPAADQAPTSPDEPAAAKPKSRPKRSKNRAAPAAEATVDERLDAAADDLAPADAEASVTEVSVAEASVAEVSVAEAETSQEPEPPIDGEPVATAATPALEEAPSFAALSESATLEAAPSESALDTSSIETSALDTSAIKTSALDTSAIETGALDASAIETGALDASAIETSALDASIADEQPAPAAAPADPPPLAIDVAEPDAATVAPAASATAAPAAATAAPAAVPDEPSVARPPAKPARVRAKAGPTVAKTGPAPTKSKTTVKPAGKLPVKAGGKKAATKHGTSAKSAAKKAPAAAKKAPAKKAASKAPTRTAAAKKSAAKGPATKKASAKKTAPKRR